MSGIEEMYTGQRATILKRDGRLFLKSEFYGVEQHQLLVGLTAHLVGEMADTIGRLNAKIAELEDQLEIKY